MCFCFLKSRFGPAVFTLIMTSRAIMSLLLSVPVPYSDETH